MILVDQQRRRRCVGSGICYWLGAAGGKPLLLKYGKYFFIRQKDIEKTESCFADHGKATIFIARFLPVVRHIISIPAGIARMPLVPFFIQTFIGVDASGAAFLIVLGYYAGRRLGKPSPTSSNDSISSSAC